jgi:hypothetical protein
MCFFLYLLSVRTAVCVNRYQVQAPLSRFNLKQEALREELFGLCAALARQSCNKKELIPRAKTQSLRAFAQGKEA